MATCAYCPENTSTSRAKTCGSAECRRAHNAARMRVYLAEKKAEAGGVRYEDRFAREIVCDVCGGAFRSRGKDVKRHRTCSALRATQIRAESARQRRPRNLPALRGSADRRATKRWRDAEAKLQAAAALPDDKRIFSAGDCEWCGAPFCGVSFNGEPQRRCSDRCSRAVNKAARRARQGRFWIAPRARLAIYERDDWTCQLCGDPVDPNLPTSDQWAATLDHIVCQSWTNAPDHSPANLRLAHRWCNSVRGDESYYGADVLAA